MIDWPRVRQLHHEVGASEFDEVVALFLDEVTEMIARLQADNERAQIEQNLHFLKGSGLSLGFATFSRLCQDGERNASAGNRMDIDLDAIITCFEQSKTVFQNELARQI